MPIASSSPKRRPYWERIPQVSPGQSSGYLEAATIYWDYFDFDNALRLLSKGRERLGDTSLYAYEAGAIYENQRDYPNAIDEYVKGALAGAGSSAEQRLLQLARRPKFRDAGRSKHSKIAGAPIQSMAAVYLRVKVLEAQNRKPELSRSWTTLAEAALRRSNRRRRSKPWRSRNHLKVYANMPSRSRPHSQPIRLLVCSFDMH